MNLKCWIGALLVALGVGCASPGQRDTPPQGDLISLQNSIEPLRQQFNADKDKVRVLALFSPT
jgi:hypothetical protein